LTSAERQLVEYLECEADKTRAMAEAGGWVYGSVEQLVLDRGAWFVPAVGLAVDPSFSGPAAHARATSGLVYVEGYYLAGGRTRLGAWSATPNGEIHQGPAAEAYLGVAMPESYRSAVTRRTGSAGVLIGQQRDGWRLLRFGLPPLHGDRRGTSPGVTQADHGYP
jgi:hypothetical protein